MNRLVKYILPLAFLFYGQAFAVTTPPHIQRACLDRNTGTLTVYFNPTSDGCNSFVSYDLYGRNNSANLFSKLASLSTLNATQMQTTLPDKKKWELYITVRYACNGTDTLNSDTVFIDDQPPAYIEPDSVSVDLTTQKLVAGWSKAPEPDVAGYLIYKVDPASGNNTLIDQQKVLFYMFSTGTFDTKVGGNRVSIAAFDSCNNAGIISNYHSPVLLAFNTGQNINYKCTHKLYIDWSAYKGWPVDSYDVIVWDSQTGLWKKDGSVSGSTLSYVFNIPALNQSYSFIVRAHKASSTITSTSNKIDITLGDFQKPSYCEIGHVSVISSGTIEVTARWEYNSSVSKVILQTKPYGSPGWSNVALPTPSVGSYKTSFGSKLTSTSKYDYRLLILNPCGVALDSSSIHTSILLRKPQNTFFWNDYWAWQQTRYKTNLLERNKLGSTWNNQNTTPDSSFVLADTTKPLCFRVLSILYSGASVAIDSAWSNEICLRVFDTTLIPTAITPGGNNPIFKIINPNLDYGQAQMLIFNRWGQKLFDGDALKGWDGTDFKGDIVGPGFYPYLINVVTSEKRESYKGVVMVLR